MRRTVIRGAAIATMLVILLGVPTSALQPEASRSSPQLVPKQETVLIADPGDVEADNDVKPDKEPRHAKKSKPERPDKALKPDKGLGADKGQKPDNLGSNGNCHGIQHAFGRINTNHGAAQGKGNAAVALQAVADRRGCDLSLAAASSD
jgi:hypothetical protein